MLEDHEQIANESIGDVDEVQEQHVTSFYGPEKPQYEEMVSIIQGDTFLMGELMDENSLGRLDKDGT